MSKKTYKRNQNRLYREIKRRIIAESALKRPMTFFTCERKIETVEVRNIIPNDIAEETEFVKAEVGRRMVNKLISEGYIEFYSSGDHYSPISDMTEIKARLYVIKPPIDH